MSYLLNKLKSTLVITSAVLVLFSTSYPALAVGRGPIGPTGPTGPTGPNGQTGRIAGYEAPDPDAQTSTQSNSDTGADSENNNSSSTETDVDATIDNTATINNDITFDANTGENETNQNTNVGDVSTGTIQGSINIVNVGNSTLGDGSSIGAQTINGAGMSSLTLNASEDRSMLNTDTGAGSNNTNTNQNGNNLTLVNNNNATANNNILVNANTGLNETNQNTNVGDVSTGAVAIDVNVFNILNVQMPDTQLTLDVWSLYDFNGDIIIPASNENTGANSANSNDVSNTTNANVTFNQNANILNDINLNANTGDNVIEDNTGTGAISTGETDINATVTNIANEGNPVFYIVQVFGNLLNNMFGNNPNVAVMEMGNQNTGEGSDNSNSVDNENNLNATINNNATANNNITVNANTGGNTTAQNTGVGAISTGDVRLTANVVNILNSMGSNLNRYTIRIVNIFGDWGGTVRQEQAAKPVVASTGGNGDTTTTLASQPVAPAATTTIDPSTSGGSSAPAVKAKASGNAVGKLVAALSKPSVAAPSTGSGVAAAQSTGTQVASATTADEGGILIKSYNSKAASGARGLSADLMKVLFIALAVLLLWGAVEYASTRNKKQVK